MLVVRWNGQQYYPRRLSRSTESLLDAAVHADRRIPAYVQV
jgi:hypothetical protein